MLVEDDKALPFLAPRLSNSASPFANLADRWRQRIMIAALFALFALSMLGPAMTFTGVQGTGEGTEGRQIAYLAVFFVVLVSVRPWQSMSRVAVLPIMVLVTLGWFWISLGWALNPSVAVRRVVLTTIIIWSIFAVVRNLGYTTSINVIRVVMLMLLVANFIAVYFFPEIGRHPKQINPGDGEIVTGLWRGIMTHKNFAGATCAFTILIFAFDRQKIPVWFCAGVIAASSYFLWQSNSKTSMGLTVFAICIAGLYHFWPGKGRIAGIIALLLMGIIGAIVGMAYRNPLQGSLTDERNLTGRPRIWMALYNYWQDNPWLGSGYGSFWNIGPNGPIFQYASGWVTKIEAGHNGYLDMLAQTGIIGLTLAVLSLVVIPLYWLLSDAEEKSASTSLLAALLSFSISHNATESSLYDRDAIVEMFFMFAIACLHVKRLRRPRSRPGRVPVRPAPSNLPFNLQGRI